MRYFTSDTHYGHANIIGFCDRPYADVHHMNVDLVDRAVAILGPDDELWHLGDVALGYLDSSLTNLARIPADVTLVAGNHDRCHPYNGKRGERFVEVYYERCQLRDLVLANTRLTLANGVEVQVSQAPMPPRPQDDLATARNAPGVSRLGCGQQKCGRRGAECGGWLRCLGSAGETCGMDVEGRRRLGGAVYRADTAEIVALLTPDVTRELPQIAGQAVLVALAQRTPGAAEAAAAIITSLSEREWDGDDEFRTQLERAVGADAGSALPSIPVELGQLVELLQGGEHHSGGRLNVRTGETLPHLMFAELADQFDEEAVEDKWLYIDALGSREAYRDMERFIADIVPPLISGPLTEAITGKGAFARFRSRIADWPDLVNAWRLYSEERWLGRARLWLAEAGYQPA